MTLTNYLPQIHLISGVEGVMPVSSVSEKEWKTNIVYASTEATMKDSPLECRRRKHEEKEAAAVARGEIPA